MARKNKSNFAATLLLCLTLLLGACASGANTNSGSQSQAQSETSGATQVETITYQAASGEVEIPKILNVL